MSRPALLATETRSWIAVFLWMAVIFITIPLARSLQSIVRDSFGKASFGYLVIAVLVAVTIFVIFRLKQVIQLGHSNLWWLVACCAFLVAYTVRLWDNPVEAVHFLQYGFLAVLLFYAFLWRYKNHLVYLAVIMATALIGIIDEAIQWLVPKRVWGLSDIGINTLSAVVVCLAIAFGIKPASVGNQLTLNSWRLITRLAIACVSVLLLSFANTPDAIKWYGDKIVALKYLVDRGHIMAEYGHRYRDSEIGLFRSRFAPDELRRQDQQRAIDAAEKLDAAPLLSDYGDFIQRYSPATDPFLHELRVHLNRRDFYLKTGKQVDRYSYEERQRRLQNAWFENRIVEKYFPYTLKQSTFTLSEEDRQLARSAVKQNQYYESPVSETLITFVSKPVLLSVLAMLLFSLLLFDFIIGKKARHAHV